MQPVDPYVVLTIIGPDGSGKSTLAQALSTTARAALRGVQIDGRSAMVVDVQGPSRIYQFVDFADEATEQSLLATSRASGAVLVVSAADSILPGTKNSMEAAAAYRIPVVAVALTKCDIVEDDELIDLVTMEIRELLNKYRLPGDQLPVVRIGAREREGRPREGERRGAGGLLNAVIG